MFGKRNKEARDIKKAKAAYQTLKPETVERMLYGDEEFAIKMLLLLQEVLYGRNTPCRKKDLEAIEFFYINVWIRRHGGLDPVFSTTPYIKMAVKKRFPQYAEMSVEKAVDIILLYISCHETKSE